MVGEDIKTRRSGGGRYGGSCDRERSGTMETRDTHKAGTSTQGCLYDFDGY